MTFEAALSTYGPLIMGWVVAYIIWRRYTENIERWIEHSTKDTEAKIRQADAFRDAIKELGRE